MPPSERLRMTLIKNIANNCRVCGEPTHEIENFGEICISDFPSIQTESPTAPLILEQCTSCELVQLRHTVDLDVLYKNYYWYQSGLNSMISGNLRDIGNLVNSITVEGDVVLDIGANDGTLLSFIHKNRYRIGCEPAQNLVKKLAASCDEVFPEFWHHDYMNGRKAKVITAIGMFYDLDNPNSFINSIARSLTDDGIFIAQLMTLAPMMRANDLGNICHEHLEYYSYKSLVKLYEQNGLEIFDVIENGIQGGSYQLWARPFKSGSINYIEEYPPIHECIKTIYQNGDILHNLLTNLTNANKRCYVYGASTKGNTVLQIWNLVNIFEGAAEIHPDKIGRYTVGTNIPIVDENFAKKNADVFFVPNYGFKESFIEKEKEWIKNGGIMIFANPKIEIIDKDNI